VYAHRNQEAGDADRCSHAFTYPYRRRLSRQYRTTTRLDQRVPKRSSRPRTDRHRICPRSDCEAGFLVGVRTPLGAGTPVAVATNDGGDLITERFSRGWERPKHTLEGSRHPYAAIGHRSSRRKGAGPLSRQSHSVTDHDDR